MRLIDASELLEHLEACLQNGRPLSNLYDLGEIVRYVKSMPTITVSPWHRAEEELPKIGKIVLAYDDLDRLSICKLDKQYRWLRLGGGWFDVPYVRYWMPIEPPKEGV